jgi:hypothetical protein
MAVRTRPRGGAGYQACRVGPRACVPGSSPAALAAVLPVPAQGNSMVRMVRSPCRVGHAYGTYRGLWAVAHAAGTCVRSRRLRRLRYSSREHANQPFPTASDTARVAGAWGWCAAPPGALCGPRLRGARRACAWPPYRPQCSVASWPGWYGRRVPARPGDSPRPARLCAPHAS